MLGPPAGFGGGNGARPVCGSILARIARWGLRRGDNSRAFADAVPCAEVVACWYQHAAEAWLLVEYNLDLDGLADGTRRACARFVIGSRPKNVEYVGYATDPFIVLVEHRQRTDRLGDVRRTYGSGPAGD